MPRSFASEFQTVNTKYALIWLTEAVSRHIFLPFGRVFASPLAGTITNITARKI